jgi:hypothetical protein
MLSPDLTLCDSEDGDRRMIATQEAFEPHRGIRFREGSGGQREGVAAALRLLARR